MSAAAWALAALLAGPLSAPSPTPTPTASPGDEAAAALLPGDAASAGRRPAEALAAYARAVALRPGDAGPHCKLAQAHADAGLVAQGAIRARHFQDAEAAARRCLALAPGEAQGHFMLAVALGRQALDAPARRRVELGREVYAAASRAVELDPRHDAALHVLGRWHYEVASLNWASKLLARVLYGKLPAGGYAEARGLFERALAIDPRAPSHHFWLAETLLELRDPKGARMHFEQCLALPDQIAEDALLKARARARLQRLRIR